MLGILFIILSNYFRILTPQVTGYVVNSVETELRDHLAATKSPETNAADRSAPATARATATAGTPATATQTAAQRQTATRDTANYDILVRRFIRAMDTRHSTFSQKVVICGITLLVLALIRDRKSTRLNSSHSS